MSTANPLISLANVKKHFTLTKGVLLKRTLGIVKAVDGVSLDIYPGETLGIVGETGCGKTTLGRVILGLEKPTSGQVTFENNDTGQFNKAQWKAFRGQVQIVFQDPYSSLNPRIKVRDIVAEPLRIHNLSNGKTLDKRIDELLETVGLSRTHGQRYPHEFSGGQRQRIGIARALALNPKLIICDEPVSALDVSIQAQVLNLLSDLQKEFNLTYVFISHDLSVVQHIANRVAVMYLGKIVELAPTKEIFTNPQHPYTEALLSACPIADPKYRNREKILLTGDVPSPLNPPSGCHFHPRCRYVQESCKLENPEIADSVERRADRTEEKNGNFWTMTGKGWTWQNEKHGALCPVQPFAKHSSKAAIHFKEEGVKT